ncbi:MAG: bifunctional demethylmenaquinone methyltransferase/2-methoxy-6-polyprenyl-1,4-benzoquinol methylase UbiE [Polyangiaceae bacterium]|nr:bifunctional demethylmenaquinone methyltransferase/2-methoxy-6-polyprenyl-1,4-benzoquinol methylase UbiE [Polyangiaceae bacterium]
MFDRIAVRYDLMNRVLSLGSDVRWRHRMVAALGSPAPRSVLDLATGTGDVACLVARRLARAEVVGLDPSEGMLAVARQKARVRGLGDRVHFVGGDAEALPFESASFDAVTMAFGIRNVPDRRRAVGEMRRVLRPRGRALVLELCEPQGHLLSPLVRLWNRQVMPRLGALVGAADAYAYLDRSIRAFPPAAVFAATLRDAGFAAVRFERLSFGAAALFVADAPA